MQSYSNSFGLQAQPPSQAVAVEKSPNYQWILHPAIDLVFVCGGLLWLLSGLLVAGVLPNDPQGPAFYAITMTALVVFVLPHQLQTYVRVWTSPTTREKLGKPVLILGVLCLGLGVICMASPLGAAIIGRITLAFAFQHFFLQAFGISLLYCYKRGFYMSRLEKNTLMALCYAGTWSAIFMLFTRDDLNAAGYVLMKGSTVPFWMVQATDVVVALLTVAFAALMAVKYQKTKKVFPWPALFTLVSCFCFMGYLSRCASFLAIVLLGQALYHSTQYAAVTLAYHIKENNGGSLSSNKEIWKMLTKPVSLKYVAFVLAGGVLMATLLTSSMEGLGKIAGFQPELCVVAWFCVMSLHHYMVDGLIWKMKDKKTLETLVA